MEMCGSRTEICEMCGQRVMLKDLDEHKMHKCASVRAESPLDPNTLENLDFSQQEYYGDVFGYDNMLHCCTGISRFCKLDLYYNCIALLTGRSVYFVYLFWVHS